MRAREESYSLVTTTLGRTEGEVSWGLGRVDCSIDINEKLGTSCSRDVVFANSVSPNNKHGLSETGGLRHENTASASDGISAIAEGA